MDMEIFQLRIQRLFPQKPMTIEILISFLQIKRKQIGH